MDWQPRAPLRSGWCGSAGEARWWQVGTVARADPCQPRPSHAPRAGFALGVGLLQGDTHQAVGTLFHPLLSHRRAQDVAQQRFSTLCVKPASAGSRVQRQDQGRPGSPGCPCERLRAPITPLAGRCVSLQRVRRHLDPAFRLFENLKYVVIDAAHEPRGLRGPKGLLDGAALAQERRAGLVLELERDGQRRSALAVLHIHVGSLVQKEDSDLFAPRPEARAMHRQMQA